MTNEELEIVREYKAAKQPLKQIGILADLNGVDKSEIVRILREALPCRSERGQERPQGRGRFGFLERAEADPRHGQQHHSLSRQARPAPSISRHGRMD